MQTNSGATQEKYNLKTKGGGTYKVAPGESIAVRPYFICQLPDPGSSLCRRGQQRAVAPCYAVQVAGAGLYPLLRAGSGAFVSGKLSEFRKRPEQPIIVYGGLPAILNFVVNPSVAVTEAVHVGVHYSAVSLHYISIADVLVMLICSCVVFEQSLTAAHSAAR